MDETVHFGGVRRQYKVPVIGTAKVKVEHKGITNMLVVVVVKPQ